MTSPQTPSWHARLAELGIRLPPVAAPVASYVPAIRTGSLVFTSGQLPFVDGGLRRTGKVGGSVRTAGTYAATGAATGGNRMPSSDSRACQPGAETVTTAA